jgi:hypothetical protein
MGKDNIKIDLKENEFENMDCVKPTKLGPKGGPS